MWDLCLPDPRLAKVSKGFESLNLQGRVNSLGSSIFAGLQELWNSSSRVGSGSSGYGGSVSISGCLGLVSKIVLLGLKYTTYLASSRAKVSNIALDSFGVMSRYRFWSFAVLLDGKKIEQGIVVLRSFHVGDDPAEEFKQLLA
ncbi:hypothetical protein Tco_0302918 [Tanacetum coccineum]